MKYVIDCDALAEHIDDFISQITIGKLDRYEHEVEYDGTKEEIADRIAANARKWAMETLRMTDRQIAEIAYRRKTGMELDPDNYEAETAVYTLRFNDDLSDEEAIERCIAIL